jgi:hypothetical protein
MLFILDRVFGAWDLEILGILIRRGRAVSQRALQLHDERAQVMNEEFC